MGLMKKTPGVCVLASGGIESAVMLRDLAKHHTVFPLYITCGLVWETEEEKHLRKFLKSISSSSIQKLARIALPLENIYRNHWSMKKGYFPAYNSHDSEMYLPGRNLLLLTQAAVYCSLHRLFFIAHGTLKTNPFSDASAAFFKGFSKLSSSALNHSIKILVPFIQLTKVQVLKKGRNLPLHLTFSCIHPVKGRHCGVCNKCAERKKAFTDTGIPDKTPYADAF